ncbi:MAG TPA: DNRLRE domain-containing protein [Candidatus Acidoferrum sp.]|jgi:hypothetical protein
MKNLGNGIARRATSLLLCSLLLAALPAFARERKILQKKTSAPADPQTRAANTWVDSSSTGTNHGTDTLMNVDNRQIDRSLAQFDLSSIPNAGIKLATLSLFLSTAPTSGNARTYSANRITSLWSESAATWTSRLSSTAWAAAGGDTAAATASVGTGTTNNVTLSWAVTPDVQRFFGSATPSGNYGWEIEDTVEGSNHQTTSSFTSNRGVTEANRPSLTVEFVQNVTNLTATPSTSTIVLNWTYPAAVGTVLAATNGVLILRQASSPIASTAAPVDGTTYVPCVSTIGGATVVFSSTSSPTTFNDSLLGNNLLCAAAPNTVYFYKVFARDSSATVNYSANGTSSSFVPMTVAEFSTTVANQEAASWINATGATTLAAPGLIPGTVMVIGSNSNLVTGVSPTDGTTVFSPVSTGGAIAGRPQVLDSATSALAVNVAYLADGDGFVYAINASTGNIIWMTNPTGLTTNGFTLSPAVVVASTSAALGSSYTRTTDLVVVGTRNAGSTTANQIVGVDGTTGATVWSVVGGGANPSMDIVTSTPFIDYKNGAIWVTTHAAGGTTQPSLWKMNIQTGAKLATANLGDISSSPIVTNAGDVVFVGTDLGLLVAANPATAATFATFAGSDTKVTGTPILLTNTSPYIVAFAGAGKVQAVSFNLSTKTFSQVGSGTWITTMPGTTPCSPSSPVGFQGLANIYVGCSDGNLYQLDVTLGTITGTKVLSPGGTIGDPTVDLQLSRIAAGSTDGHVYTFPFPF